MRVLYHAYQRRVLPHVHVSTHRARVRHVVLRVTKNPQMSNCHRRHQTFPAPSQSCIGHLTTTRDNLNSSMDMRRIDADKRPCCILEYKHLQISEESSPGCWSVGDVKSCGRLLPAKAMLWFEQSSVFLFAQLIQAFQELEFKFPIGYVLCVDKISAVEKLNDFHELTAPKAMESMVCILGLSGPSGSACTTPRRPTSSPPATVQKRTCFTPTVTKCESESGRNSAWNTRDELQPALATRDPAQTPRSNKTQIFVLCLET